MGGYQTLPMTGAGVLTIGGLAFGPTPLLLIGALAVVIGVVLARFAWRRGKHVGEA